MIFMEIFCEIEFMLSLRSNIKNVLSKEFKIEEESIKVFFSGPCTTSAADHDMRNDVIIIVYGLPSNVGVAEEFFKEKIRTCIEETEKGKEVTFFINHG
jgi:hypothetical protein